MSIKKMLSVTLCGLLLAAGVTAYADDEAKVVILKGATEATKTWSEFVTAINNPTSIKGVIEQDLPATHPDREALDEANEALKLAKDTVQLNTTAKGTAEGKLSSAQGTLSAKETALNTYIAENVTPKKEAYETEEKNLKGWEKEVVDNNALLTPLTARSQRLGAQIEAAKDSLSDLKEEYDNLGKTVTTTTNDSITPWLYTIHKDASDYLVQWNKFQENKTYTEKTIYYDLVAGRKGQYSIAIAFEDPKGAGDRDWETASTLVAFEDIFYPTDYPNGISLTSAYVYLGSNYSENEGYLTIKTLSGLTRIIQDAVNELTTLTKTSGYYTQTIETETTYDDPDEEEILAQAIKDKNAWIKALGVERNSVSTQLGTIEKKVNDAQSNIDKYTKIQEGKTVSEQTRLYNEWQEAEKAVEDSQAYKDVEEAQTEVDNAQKEVDEAVQALADANAKVTTATANVTAAQKVAQESANVAARGKYKDITLTADVTATAQITEVFDGNIVGNNNVITVAIEGDKPLFSNLKGTLNKIAVNGELATNQVGATFGEVALWDGSNGEYYTKNGVGTPYTNIGELGFATRSQFGVDFSVAKPVLANLVANPDTKVYSITTYQPGSQVQYFVNAYDNEFYAKDKTVFTLPANSFALSASNDLKGYDNIIYQDGDNKVCDHVEILDTEDFYLPFDILAKEVYYPRTFNQGHNSVVLPFGVKYAGNENIPNFAENKSISGLCIYADETAEKFWFKKEEEKIEANTPFLLVADTEFSFGTLTNLYLKQTPENQLNENEGSLEDPSKSIGLFKKANITGLAPTVAGSDYTIYGLSSKGTWVSMNSKTPAMPAFRTVIYSALSRNTGEKAPRRIAVRDGRGVEIPGLGSDFETGVESVEAATSFEIAGGQGEIIFTADADYGKVPVYTVDGHVATVANVTAGTTTANVQKGIYIVNGKKVMVK